MPGLYPLVMLKVGNLTGAADPAGGSIIDQTSKGGVGVVRSYGGGAGMRQHAAEQPCRAAARTRHVSPSAKRKSGSESELSTVEAAAVSPVRHARTTSKGAAEGYLEERLASVAGKER